jgi:hypothetical protein
MLRPLLLLVLLAPLAALAADPTTWGFDPPRDPASGKTLLDLRSLNEKVAGEKGFVTVDAGGEFRLGSGERTRFWAVNTNVGREKPWVARPRWGKDEPSLEYHAKFLARRGVNMVRLHAHLNPDLKANPKATPTDINEKDRDWIWRTVAAMKKEGIYTTVSPYWANTLQIGKDWGIPGGAEQGPHGLLFFDETLQTAYKAWWKALLAEKNPYTGMPLAQDPALAILQLQNEDSLLFWTTNGIKGEQRKRLGKKFAAWAAKKYGSLDAASMAWEKHKLPGDDLTQGVLDLDNMYLAVINPTGGQAKRFSDQVQFFCETMYAFNVEMIRYLREELGCKQVVNAGNWKTADTARLNDAERWSYTPGEVLAVNRYFGGMHTGTNSGWAVADGHQFTRLSALRDPSQLSINLKRPVGKAMLVTEGGWVMPNGYGAEGPFLVAAYMSLTGVNGFYWFATGSDGWEPPQSANGYMPSQAKWPIATPDFMGTFPATALLFRQGLVARAAPAVREQRALTDLWQRRVGIISEEASFDPNRDKGNLPPTSSVREGLPWEAFLVGPVEVTYDGNPAKSTTLDLDKFINRKTKVIKSETGELTFDHGQGFCLIDAPKAQGVAAHLPERRTFTTRHLKLDLGAGFTTVLAVPLDSVALGESERVLVQVCGNVRPTSWTESPTTIEVKEGKFPGFKLESVGKSPWQVAKTEGTVAIRNPKLTKATALDATGRARAEVPLKRDGDVATFTLPGDALYIVLTK